ncbi:type VI secretion system protein TssA [Massilia agilis]|uniref:Type VI secretion system protein TssA n=1 Tax=Massilia agilis TaxID=1811226 RepID=A0ABT2D9X5_9BURK|nr:type VI secretion system protein TssA [Massilia agilis]MCS0808049.1 type VI secretion system protein TssA [Massilia agilis]
MLNIEQLLAPISEAQPCGENLAFSPELDAIANARRADDPTLEQGAWVTTLKEADWKFVAKRCAELIEKRSKDLQLAVWLAEASARTSGLRGLADSLLLIGALCERYWDDVYPLPDEGGFDQRIGNLHWIATRAPQMILEIPITEGPAGHSMKDFEVARSHGGEPGEELEAARRRSSRAFYQQLMLDCDHCAAALADLERVVDDRVGQEGPSLSSAKAALQSLIHFVTPAAREAGALPEAAPDAPVEAADGPAPRAISSGPIQNRAQALAQLRIVAEYFRRTEPHSPVAYLAEKAANWGEQPLHLWLRAVIKDDAALARLHELLGIES